MSNFDFSQPSRQSAKGIIVIFGVQILQFVKNTFLLFVPVLLRIKNMSLFNDQMKQATMLLSLTNGQPGVAEVI